MAAELDEMVPKDHLLRVLTVKLRRSFTRLLVKSSFQSGRSRSESRRAELHYWVSEKSCSDFRRAMFASCDKNSIGVRAEVELEASFERPGATMVRTEFSAIINQVWFLTLDPPVGIPMFFG